jgi:hypothetical protein
MWLKRVFFQSQIVSPGAFFMSTKHFFSAIIIILCGCLNIRAQEQTNQQKIEPQGPLYSLPYPPGEEFMVGLGYLEFPTHTNDYAVDWTMPEETPIMAARDGTVVEVVDSFTKSGLTEEFRNKANYIILRHDDNTYTLYVHLAKGGMKVKVGQKVKEGEQIALSGNTGYSSTPHLHFMAYRFGSQRRESFPTRFKSPTDEPYSIYAGAKYLAPGGQPKEEDGPLKGIRGTGELSSIRPKLIELVKGEKDAEQAATKLKSHLLKNRAAIHDLYKKTFAKSQTGDKSAMRELQDFLGEMDLQASPEIARLLKDPNAESTANEAVQVWWQLFSLP